MTPELRITVLMENTAREGLEAEHGLSFFLEYRGRRFLLDAGSSGRFADNAQQLGVDLDGVELAALSGAGPLPAGSPICCARWGRTGSCPTTFPTSSPWCWRPGGGWWCSTPAAMGVW